MPASDIDTLCDLWAASMLKYNGAAPFAGHRDLYSCIDEVKVGDVRWSSFKLSYKDQLPAGDESPSWMTAEYEVWYRNPHEVVKNMLANTDFDGEMDSAPYRDYDANGDRQYSNFMSADWAWKQAVMLILAIPFTVAC
jgi:hypothetical protein